MTEKETAKAIFEIVEIPSTWRPFGA
jgi:hypothetical protein